MSLESRTFRAVSYPLRLYSGTGALDKLKTEVERQKAKRAFVICGQTIAHKTDLLARISDNLGSLYAGAFDGMDKDSSWPAVEKGVVAAKEANADLLVAVGGGSVIVGARVVAILLAEEGDPFDLMTQIINVATTPNTAMNRAGSGLKNEDLDHRMEYYDPKTRPVAVFWDAEALLTAPSELIRSTATTNFSSTLRTLGETDMSPLVEGDHRQGFKLLRDALPRIMEEPDNAALRIDLCAAAFLQNRAGDDDQGRRTARDQTGASAYALATALHIRYHHVWQGESTSCVMPTVTRLTPPDNAESAARIADAMGVWRKGMNSVDAATATADRLEEIYREIGMPSRIRDVDIPKADLPLLAQDTLKNFNANPGNRPDDYVDQMLSLLEASW